MMNRLMRRTMLAVLVLTCAVGKAQAIPELEGKPLCAEGNRVGLMLSPDGKSVAAIDVTGGVRLWSVPDGKPLGTFAGNGSPGCIAFSPNGKLLAVSNKGVVKIWDLTTRRPVTEIQASAVAVNNLAFSPDGKLLAIHHVSGSIQRTQDNRPEWEKNLPPVPGYDDYLPVDPNTGQLRGVQTWTEYQYSISLWNWAENENVDTRACPLDYSKPFLAFNPAKRIVEPVAVSPITGLVVNSPDGKEVVARTALKNGKISEVFRLPVAGTVHRVSLAATTADAMRVAVMLEPSASGAIPYLQVWDRSGTDPVLNAVKRKPHKTPVNALIVTPTGSAIITAAEDGSVVLWTIPDGK